MFQKGCLLVGLFALAAVVLTGCTPAVQSEGAAYDGRTWSNVTSSPDQVDVEVLPYARGPRRARIPANVTVAE